MKDLIVNALELFCKIGVFLFVIVGTLAGWIATGNPFVTLFCLIVSFTAAVVIFGILFLFIDINDNIRSLRYTVEKNSEPPQK